MTWANFYLVCFVVGFAFSLISFLSGGMNWHFHSPHWHGGHLHFGGHAPILHAPVAGHAPVAHAVNAPRAAGALNAIAGAKGAVQAVRGTWVSPFNFVTFTAFLAWFGGTGYLLTRYSSVWFAIGFGIALAAGLLGAGIVFLFLSKVLTSEEENMDPADYEMVGVLGRMSISIREGGTGEIIYSQAGTRRVCGARSESGGPIAKGVEVVVTRYERGIAYVRPWAEMSEDEAPAESTAP